MEVFMSRERIQSDACRAAAEERLPSCPPEFLPHKDLWLAEYGKALTDAAIKTNRLPGRQAMALAEALQEG